MASKHTPDDQKLIDTLPLGVVMAFRSSIFNPSYIINNPHRFITNDWIDASQLRDFLHHTSNSTPARVKLENDAVDASLTRPLAPARVPDDSSVLTVKTRTLKEAGREVLEILSDSEPETTLPLPSSGPGSDDTSNFRESSPLPPSDFPSETSYTESDGYLSSDEHASTVPDLEVSDTLWADPEILSFVRIGDLRVTTEVTVQRMEYLTEFASLYPIPDVATAFVIYAEDPRFYTIVNKHGLLRTMDAVIKNKDNDSWSGGTGTGDSGVWVMFEPGQPPIWCRRSRLNCTGSYHCNQVNLGLLNVIRRDLDPASREAVFAAQRQTRREDGSTAERKVAESRAVNGFGSVCSGFTATSNGKHRSWTIPDDVDEPMFIKGMHGEPLVGDKSRDTSQCSAIVHPTTGLKRKHCPHAHIVDGMAVVGRVVHRGCFAERTIYVPIDPSVRKALIVHHDIPHNHPMFYLAEQPTDAPSADSIHPVASTSAAPLSNYATMGDVFDPDSAGTYFPAVSAPAHHLFPKMDDILYLPAASKIDDMFAFNDSAFLPPNDLEDFDWSFLDDFGSGPADTSITSSFDGAASFSAQFSAPASPPRLPPIPISPSPPPAPLVAPPAAKPLSRKRKNDIDGLDPANVLEGQSRSRRVRKRSS
ncbi:hypothetical protein B0H14DRAFT_3700283 [Mycena olivaceomarginata]|nr:hypothetical protein B0H14DRAFT_3700283 [Mycena olivaceomarginata]